MAGGLTTFSSITPITPLTRHTYSTRLKDSWSIGAVPNGGYVTSLFLVVARAHMTRSHASANQPDPINLHLEFLRRTSADADAVFRVRELKVGSRISNLHVTLSQKSGGEGKEEVWRDNVEGYVTMSNLARESGLTLPTSLTLYPPPPGPANLELLARESRDDHYVLQPPFAFRAAQHIRVYLPRADKQAKGRAKKSYVDQWVRFWPEGREGRWTNDALGYVVDMFPQIVEEYLLPREEESSAGAASSRTVTQRRPQANFWYPTLSLNLDVRRALPEEGVEWLFVRVGSRVIRNGRMDLEVLVLDEAGEVVATSTHQGLIVGTERNVAGRKYKQEKEGRTIAYGKGGDHAGYNIDSKTPYQREPASYNTPFPSLPNITLTPTEKKDIQPIKLPPTPPTSCSDRVVTLKRYVHRMSIGRYLE